jgi:hypothetical protein
MKKKYWFLGLFVAAILYISGFYLVVFGFRSNSDSARLFALQLDTALYHPLISSSSENGVIRKLSRHRIALLCEEYKERCRLESNNSSR